MPARLRHVWLALTALPSLLRRDRRRLFAEVWALARRLPVSLADPLPQVLHALAPRAPDVHHPATVVRTLVDLAALADRSSPLGLCLRRSLLRYHFLRRAGVPVTINFGARLSGGVPDRDVTGHAWITLDGQPFFEDGDNYRGFTVMLQHPAPG